MQVQDIFSLLNECVIGESIQQMIKDMKKTQHGDRTNPLYELLKDYHVEGGVWKHTKLAIEALPDIAKGLSDALDDPEYLALYDQNKNELRAAALYHDIGKLSTQKPSKSRKGSYSFQGHSDQEIIDSIFALYNIKPSVVAKNLVLHHHDTPAEAESNFANDTTGLKLLMIVKGVDRIAVGPKTLSAAIEGMVSFLDQMKPKEGVSDES